MKSTPVHLHTALLNCAQKARTVVRVQAQPTNFNVFCLLRCLMAFEHSDPKSCSGHMCTHVPSSMNTTQHAAPILAQCASVSCDTVVAILCRSPGI